MYRYRSKAQQHHNFLKKKKPNESIFEKPKRRKLQIILHFWEFPGIFSGLKFRKYSCGLIEASESQFHLD